MTKQARTANIGLAIWWLKYNPVAIWICTKLKICTSISTIEKPRNLIK